MKKLVVRLFFMLSLTTLFAACNRHGDVDVSVKESDDEYRFKAYYNEDRTDEVYDFINKSMSPNKLFRNDDDVVNGETAFDDGARFRIKARKGELVISIDKGKDNQESVARIRKMCQGLKEVIVD